MMLRTIIAKSCHEFLKRTGLYSILLNTFKTNPNAKLFDALEINKNLSLESKNFPVAEGCYLIFQQENSLSDFDIVTQSNKPFWKCSWKGFDPKDYWEIARGWQWLPAYLGAEENEQSLVIEEIIAWLENNPYPNGLAWAVGLDVAIRSINLLLIYEISQDTRLINYLWQHYLYLKKMLWLSKNAIRNNHYLGERVNLQHLPF